MTDRNIFDDHKSEDPGWTTQQNLETGDFHTIPVDDHPVHSLEGSCRCEPDATELKLFGSDEILRRDFLHHAWDRRARR